MRRKSGTPENTPKINETGGLSPLPWGVPQAPGRAWMKKGGLYV